MTKRPKVEIDEEAIKRIMAGDIPRMRQQVSQMEAEPEPAVASGSDTPASQAEAPEAKTPRSVRRKPERDYAGLFLRRREPAPKRQTYMNRQIYDKIAAILAVVANELTVPVFIDNVLAEHLEQYRDIINELYESKTKKPL